MPVSEEYKKDLANKKFTITSNMVRKNIEQQYTSLSFFNLQNFIAILALAMLATLAAARPQFTQSKMPKLGHFFHKAQALTGAGFANEGPVGTFGGQVSTQSKKLKLAQGLPVISYAPEPLTDPGPPLPKARQFDQGSTQSLTSFGQVLAPKEVQGYTPYSSV